MKRTGARAATCPLEKVEQQNIVQLALTIHAAVWVVGTKRSRGKACAKCGTFVAEHQGTRQTEGHPDLVIFLPSMGARLTRLLYWEVKRQFGSKTSSKQKDFETIAEAASIDYGRGCFDEFIAWLVRHNYVRLDSFSHSRQRQVQARQVQA